MLNANYQALAQHRPQLLKHLEALESVPAFSHCVSSPTNRPDVRLRLGPGHEELLYGDLPSSFSSNWAGSLELKNPRLLFVLGLGLGDGILEYLRSPHPAQQGLVIVEQFPHLLKIALESYDLSAVIARPDVFFVLGPDQGALEPQLQALFSQIRWLRCAQGMAFAPFAPSYRLGQTFYQALQNLVPRIIGERFNNLFSDPYDGYRGLQNILANGPFLGRAPALQVLHNRAKGCPGIVVGSGPSLEDSLKTLKQSQGKAVLAASPSVIPALKKHGIRASVWVHQERSEEEIAYFKSLGEPDCDLFVASPFIQPEICEWAGDKLCFVFPPVFCDWLPGDVTTELLGHSTAHMAFRVLETLGCSDISLLGIDLVGQGDRSHVKEAWQASQVAQAQFKEKRPHEIQVQTEAGETAPTHPLWFTFIRTFCHPLISQCQVPVYHVGDKTKMARLDGSVHQSPDELTQRLAEQAALSPLDFSLSGHGAVLNAKELTEKTKRALGFLKDVERESREFSLSVKRFLFSPEMRLSPWSELKPLYLSWQNQANEFFAKFLDARQVGENQEHYRHLLYPILQGTFLQTMITYFGSDADLQGDRKDINRKLSLVDSMAREQSFWAQTLCDLLTKSTSN